MISTVIKNRLLPILGGLAVACTFIFTENVWLSHLLYLGAAAVLYTEVFRLNYPTAFLRAVPFWIGSSLIVVYTLCSALLLSGVLPVSPGNFHIILFKLTHYELSISWLQLSALLLFLLAAYSSAIFRRQDPTQLPLQKSFNMQTYFQALSSGFHALCYTLFFLYSIVKLKYGYLFLPASALTVTAYQLLLLTAWSMVWVYDSAAYIGGTRWGKNKKLRLLSSPNKSWVGLYCGIAVTAMFGGVLSFVPALKTLTMFNSLWHGIMFGVLLAVSAQVGDLIASFLKRVGQTKNSGTLFSAHGGFLDRNDSAIFTLMVLYYIMAFTAP